MSERLADGEVAAVTAGELARLRAENARLLRLLKLTGGKLRRRDQRRRDSSRRHRGRCTRGRLLE